MLTLLAGFAALSLISGLLMSLLPEGSLRHAASMAVGLVMLLYWAQGLQSLLADVPAAFVAPDTMLSSTGVSLPEAESALMQEASP